MNEISAPAELGGSRFSKRLDLIFMPNLLENLLKG